MKDGERMSYLAWNHLRLSYSDILEEYIKQIAQMSEHAFFASWNYGQYKKSKSNIQHGEVVMVQDFAQNYLCNLQNEPQAIHWLHKQATLHPTVVHYKCPVDDCHTVTHEVVHISNDLKHDAHLVEKFHQATMKVLKDQNVEVCKIVKFTDHAPSQYKNKTSFAYLSKHAVLTMHCFYGIRHGKGPCDACTGLVKQAMVRLVKNRTCVADTPEVFFSAAKEHLTTEKANPGKCVHYRQTFHFTNKLTNRPKGTNLTAIPDTRQLHVVCNTGNVNEVNMRRILCCCAGCLRNDGECDNASYTDEWQAYDMLSRKRIPQNMAFWSNVQPCHEIHNIRWEERLQQMNFTNFTQLEHYVRANLLPQMEFLNINDEMLQCEKSRLDYIALHHLPTDAPDGYAPVNIFGDGNCFPRTCSYLVGKNEDRYTEFRVCIVYELVQNKDIYLNDTYVSKGASIIYGRGSTVDQIAMFSEHYNPMLRLDTETLYNLELLDICKDGAYMGMWQILAAANILQHPICSVYPDLRRIVRPDLNRRVYCYNEALNTK